MTCKRILQPRSKRRTRATAAALLALCGLVSTGCGGGSPTGGTPEPSTRSVPLSAQAALGELIFNDASLSASGRQSCSSCHDPAQAHASPNTLPAQLGGAALEFQGGRNAPSIRYLADNRAFRFEADGTPAGGTSLL